VNDTTVSNHVTAPAIPAGMRTLRRLLAFLLGAAAACLVAALGVGVLMAIGSPDIPGEEALKALSVLMYAVLSLMFVVPLVIVFGVPYALLLLAFGRFRLWPMALGGFAIAGGPALISAVAMQYGLSGWLLDVMAVLGAGAAIMATAVPYPAAGLVLGVLGALGAAAFHRTYVWIAPRQ
jgi:hypothetical protein